MEQIPLDAFVIDGLLPDLIGHDRRASALVVYLFLYRRTVRAAWQTRMSHQSIASATGLSRSAVQAALAHLQARELITSSRATPTAVPLHKVHRPWHRLSRSGKGS